MAGGTCAAREPSVMPGTSAPETIRRQVTQATSLAWHQFNSAALLSISSRATALVTANSKQDRHPARLAPRSPATLDAHRIFAPPDPPDRERPSSAPPPTAERPPTNGGLEKRIARDTSRPCPRPSLPPAPSPTSPPHPPPAQHHYTRNCPPRPLWRTRRTQMTSSTPSRC